MKVRIREIRDGRTHSKLACVKRVKELTGLGLKESKEIVDASSYEAVEFDVDMSRGDIEKMKYIFNNWGFDITGGRQEAIDDLLGDSYKYIIEYLHRCVTYRVEEGEMCENNGRYEITVSLGVKIDDSGETNISNKKIIVPIDAISIEENIL